MIGKRFAHYDVLERVGSGGMGEVYRARDLTLGREVAVKFLPGRFAGDPERLARFEQEARAASSLNHPNIVTIHEIGQAEGLPYIVMEMVHGRTLRQLLDGKPLPVKRILELAPQVAEGLAKAHAAGIVHRDLKPENVMVSDDGFVKLVDFGLAKLLEHTAEREAPPAADTEADTHSLVFGLPGSDAMGTPDTAAGVILGTVGYMSPEQARGRPVDFRSDQFALGAILYEMVTGKRAFEGETAVQTLAAIIEDEPRPIVSLNPGAPPPLRWLVDRCLAKDPRDRYASTQDLARELRTVQGRVGEVSGPTPAPAPAPPRRFAALGATVATALVVVPLLVPSVRDRLSDALRSRPVPAEKQIAVLGFATSSQDAATRAFSDGLIETLTTKLTQLAQFHGALWVVPASEVRQSGVASAEAARRVFGVTLVLTGSLQRIEGRLRLTANLVDASTLRQLRALSVDAPAGDVEVWQDGIVNRVVEMLDLEFGPPARRVLSAGGTEVAGAWELYVEGCGFLQRYDSAESLEKAVGLFQQALQRDPSYALAYAGMGEAHWRLYKLTKRPESVELARKACQRAVDLNDLLAPVHVTLGLIHAGTGRFDDAVTAFRKALALDPASADAMRELADAYERVGRPADAEATYKKVIALRPGYWAGHNHLGVFYLGQRRNAEAEMAFRRVVDLTPDNLRGYNNLGALYHLMGRYDEAEAVLTRSVAIAPNASALSNLATVQFFRSRYAEAARTLEKAIALRENDYVLWYNLAGARYWDPGERDKARAAYERAAHLAEADRAVNPRDPSLLVLLADCYGMIGDASKARSLAARALELAPDDADVLFRAAGLHEHLGDRERALRLVTEALRRGYSQDEIERTPTLSRLREDPRYASLRTTTTRGGRS